MARRKTKRRARRRYHPLVWIAVAVFGASIIMTLAFPRTAAIAAPAAPLDLAQWGTAGALASGSALNRSTVVVSFLARAGSSVAVPEVEVAAGGLSYTDRISARGPLVPAGERVTVRMAVPRLRDGVAYRWRARLRGQDGRSSAWVTFGSNQVRPGAAFLVALTPPHRVQLASPTHPDPNTWYTSMLASLTWSAPASAAGIAGYAYSLDHTPDGVPAPRIMTDRPEVDVLLPSDGQWYVHVRAVDRAGNWSQAATYPIRIDRHPTAFSGVTFSQTSFDPDIERDDIAVSLAGTAHLSVRILDQLTGSLVRSIDLGNVSGQATVAWDGRDNAGRPAPAGAYRFLLTATDPYGQQAVADYSGITVLRRRIVVSLSQQRLIAYDGTRAVADTLVTTGNQKLPTPIGVFHILEKLHPYTFISPWPQGSPYYYEPSSVQYALMFNWNGYFIHDAPWRTIFGPGSNTQPGIPGQNLTGTHGCVNVPPSFAAWLFAWAPVGTVVQVAS